MSNQSGCGDTLLPLDSCWCVFLFLIKITMLLLLFLISDVYVYFLILSDLLVSLVRIQQMGSHLSKSSFEAGVTRSVSEVNADIILPTRLPYRWTQTKSSHPFPGRHCVIKINCISCEGRDVNKVQK